MSMSAPVGSEVIEHEIRVAATPEQVASAVVTEEGLSGWYSAGMKASATDGVVGFHASRHPVFEWSVDRPAEGEVVWTCTAGPGRSVGTQAIYRYFAAGDGRTTVRLTHLGWAEDDDAFRRCNTYWGALLFQLQRYLDTGERRPVFA
jgi:uncharacterized protein YndB with AHSA1/START domain